MTATAPQVIPFAERKFPKTLCLFDVDGTLTPARRGADPAMLDLLARLRTKCGTGFVGGSDLVKIREQLETKDGVNAVSLFDYAFAENGLTAYRSGKVLESQSFITWLGEDRYKKLAKFCLRYISELDLPVMRGTFIEFRNGMINVSPIGRNASNEERAAFEKYDKEHQVRSTFVSALKKEFNGPEWPLTFSIGGMISFDVFPTGWDKTYALKHVESDGWDEIHFFGDKTYKGGNDHEIFEDKRTIGHTVTSPEDTMKELQQLFFKD